MGRMQKRLPTRAPSTSRGSARGDDPEGASTSSKGKSMPLRERCLRKASGVFREATRGQLESLTG
jgi:hypothetical protein